MKLVTIVTAMSAGLVLFGCENRQQGMSRNGTQVAIQNSKEDPYARLTRLFTKIRPGWMFGMGYLDENGRNAEFQAAVNLVKEIDPKRLEALFSAMTANQLGNPSMEICLNEMAHRQNPLFIPILKSRVEQMEAIAQVSQYVEEQPILPGDDREKDPYFFENARCNLEILATLHRLQGKPDPVMIAVKDWQVCTLGKLPEIDVCLVNVDAERRPITITEGGPAYNGTLLRWRIEGKNEKGIPIGRRDIWKENGPDMAGGISYLVTLNYGEFMAEKLDLAKYLTIKEPGEYSLEVIYHNSIVIADRENTDGLVVFRSVPFKLTVSKPD